MFDYNSQGEITALSFAMNIEDRLVGFKLPARIDQVEAILRQSKTRTPKSQIHDQAYRTGWANIRDWVTAQMALVDTRMAQLQEVFLPYMAGKNGKTLYESMAENQFLLPGDASQSK